jgi:hypothetical protein
MEEATPDTVPDTVNTTTKVLYPRRIAIIVITLVILFQFMYFIIQYNPDMATFATFKSTKDRKKLLYVFIAIGTHPERNEVIRNNVEHIVMKNQDDDKYQIDCLIYGYAAYNVTPRWIKDIETDHTSPCKYIKVFEARYVFFFKHIPAFFLERSGYSYVTFVLDDVVHYPPISNFNVRNYFDIIFQNDLGMIAPAVKNSYWSKNTGPFPLASEHAVGRIVKFIEVQSITFKIKAWRCFNELFDTEFPSGWGIDLWFYNYCVIEKKQLSGNSIAIIDKYYVHHNPYGWAGTHVGEDTNLQVANWKDYKGIDLKNQTPDDQGILFYY